MHNVTFWDGAADASPRGAVCLSLSGRGRNTRFLGHRCGIEGAQEDQHVSLFLSGYVREDAHVQGNAPPFSPAARSGIGWFMTTSAIFGEDPGTEGGILHGVFAGSIAA